MDKKFKCPMMCDMQMMYGMQPVNMMPGMMMDEEMESYYADEEDDRIFAGMYPESCKKMMIYVKVEIDRMEEKKHKMHDERPDREMVNVMVESAYGRMVKEMPEMAEEEETRQFPGRRFTRDLLRLLILSELLRRRRRRRRRYYDYPYGGYGYGYDYDFDFDYYDYD